MFLRRVTKIISGVQTAFGRAALDIGLEFGIPIGGYCPTNARPFDLILERMEEAGNFTDSALRAQMAERFKAEGEPRPDRPLME